MEARTTHQGSSELGRKSWKCGVRFLHPVSVWDVYSVWVLFLVGVYLWS